MSLSRSFAPQQINDGDAARLRLGSEWIVDAAGCTPAMLACLSVMRGICDAIIAEADLHVVGDPLWHQFDAPGGVTGLYLLSESHLTCHTFPEFGAATFNLYCCRRRQPPDWQTLLRDHLGASRVTIREFARGTGAGERP